ncbi:ferredoxin [Methanospirillum lacunae]|uniref:Ferredoxin n=1 Tax=Methanospirillum lacunae TaxID=668570 RepID=A0A2V2N1P9_9EURY|nr:ferredoxin [Methanospirillum lacunae]PWR74254.1 ferredoxin [Methanospirillum lacunae]
MNIKIDRKDCTSCGTCWETCPKVFEQNPDDSLSQIIEMFRINGNIAEGAPTPELEDCSLNASDACPVQIIEILD